MGASTDDFVQKIESLAQSYFHEGMSPAHDWFHVQRVKTNAEELVANNSSADSTVVQLAVLLHDIGRAKEEEGIIKDHSEWGAEEGKNRLREHGAASEMSEAVAHCIRAHRYSNEIAPRTIEAKIVSDADNLDALGAVGIARCFAYGGEIGSPIHDPSLPPAADDTSIGQTQFNHLHKKLLDLPSRMYTDAGKELAEDRVTYVQQFLQRFENEVSGAK